MRCECCAEMKLTVRSRTIRVGDAEGRSNLCDPCANEGHFVAPCRKCMAERQATVMVWKCAQLDHVANEHHGILAIRENMPEPKKPEPRFRHIGKLVMPE